MNRRQFLHRTALLGAASALPQWALAEEDAFFSGFHQALKQHPWLGAYQNVQGDLESGPILFEGKLPAGLRGTLFRNGPALFERGGVRYQHPFDGDGMVQAYRFGDNALTHRGRFVRTKKYLAESEQGKFLFPGFGTSVKSKYPATTPDSFNAANTSVVAHGGRLLALWEAGSAYELDPASLETKGPLTWRDDFKGMPFSAHPKIQADGTMWNFGAFNNSIALYQIGADGRLVKAEVIPVPEVVMNHDFVVSQNHLIFVLPAMRMNREKLQSGSSFLDSIDIPKNAAMRVLTVEKADFSKRRFYELPPGFVFHYGNAWEDKNAVIRFDYVRHDAGADIMTGDMRALMRGDVGRVAVAASHSTQVVIDTKRGVIKQQSAYETVEFPRVDPRVTATRNRYLYHTASLGKNDARYGLNAVLRYDIDSGKRDAYDYGSGYLIEEHIVIPKPGSTREGEGWLVGCAFNINSGKNEVAVFDAMNLAAGPVARARLPYPIPLGFHGHFLAA